MGSIDEVSQAIGQVQTAAASLEKGQKELAAYVGRSIAEVRSSIRSEAEARERTEIARLEAFKAEVLAAIRSEGEKVDGVRSAVDRLGTQVADHDEWISACRERKEEEAAADAEAAARAEKSEEVRIAAQKEMAGFRRSVLLLAIGVVFSLLKEEVGGFLDWAAALARRMLWG